MEELAEIDELEQEEREAELVRKRVEQLMALVHERRFNELRAVVREIEIADLAEAVLELAPEDQVIVFRILPREMAAEVFEYLEVEGQEELLKAMGDRDVAEILNNMSADDRTALLEELPAKVTRHLLNLLSPDELRVASQLLGYPEDSIGRLMTPDYIAIKPHWTVAQVLEHLRKFGSDRETINVVYVVDKGVLVDDIRLREIILADPAKTVEELMDRSYVALRATDDQETAVSLIRKHDRVALPVVDSEGKLLGIVTVDDVLDVAEEEATEDIQKLGGSAAFDEPFLDITIGEMVKKRAPWLALLLLGEMLTASAMAVFEEQLASAIVLAIFIPLIISSGGNSGSQAATLVTRALALGEVRISDWWHVMHRELISGLILGLILGAIGFTRVAVWAKAFGLYGEHWLQVAVTIAVSLSGVVLWGCLTGSMLPIVLKRLGLDPATSSAPFVATLVDVTGIVIYFTVAHVVLSGRLF